jgi:hypothetical protein
MNVEEVVGALKQASYGFFGYLTPYVLVKGGRVSKQTLRSAAAVATFMGSFRLLKVFARQLKYDPERKEVIQGLCGGLASSAACCVDSSFASPLFAFWFAVKGLREFLPEAKTSFYPLLTLITASAYTIPTGYVMPDEVHPSYRLFLEKWVTGIGVTTANWRSPPAAGLTLSDGVHPNQSMTSFLLTRAIPGCFVLATKFTFPLYLLTAIQAAITKKFNMKTTVVNFSRSVTFLAMYVSSCWVAVLWWSRYVGGKGPNGALTRTQCFSFAWLFGLWGLVERKSRQVELGAYILSHGLTALWMRAQKSGLLNAKKTTGQTVFLGLMLSWMGIAPLMRKSKTSYLGKLFFGD